MQIATLNYRYNPKDNFHNDSKSKFQHRHILTTVTNPPKKSKQQRSILSNVNTHSNAPLPPLKKSNKRPSSIRIKGNSLQTSKFHDASISSFLQPTRSRSRESDKSEIPGARSRSITPTGAVKSTSKLVRLKFGYPVKIRSSDFYAPDLSESELRFREESFVNDSIRTATESIRSSKTSHYDPLDDPNLKIFFQSPLILDVVRKTLNIDLDERLSAIKKRSKSNDRDDDYRRIVAKHSSGYGKLNGYDCIPPYAPTRHRRSTTHDRYQSSANTSLTSFPTYSSFQFQQKKKSHSKRIIPLATSSPLRHPTAVTSDIAAASSVSED